MAAKYDLLVIGGGTAGLVSAAGAASLGARVALVERDKLGGECLYTGCVPTKALIKSARVASLVDQAEEFGVKTERAKVDFPAVMDRMRRVVRAAGEHDDPDRFRKMGVELFLGHEASFAAPDAVAVDGRCLEVRSAIIATGSRSAPPPITGLEEVGYLTHVEALELDRLPRSVIVVGSGPIGCEFAQIFARFGSEVALISSSPLPLPREDAEVGETLKECLTSDEVTFHGGFRAQEARKEGDEKVIVAQNDRGERVEARGEEILIAAGRAPVADALSLENAGVELEGGGITVDERLRTTTPNVYAAGDITGKYLFTHVAEYQARIALRNALFPVKSKADHRVVPWTTFTDPEVAHVGLTEEEAREQHGHVRVFRQPFGQVDRAVADGETQGFVKIVTGRWGRILGGHIIGPDAGNLIQEIVLAMQKNVPVSDLSTTIHVYPTLVQANQRAADAYYREKLFTDRNRKVLSTFFGLRRRLKKRRT